MNIIIVQLYIILILLRSMSLGQTNRGYPPPIEHVGVPAVIQEEKGMDLFSRPSSSLNKPWHKVDVKNLNPNHDSLKTKSNLDFPLYHNLQSNFLKDRVDELKPVMMDLDPHIPDLTNLQVVGTSNPYERYIRAATPCSVHSEGRVIQSAEEEENIDPLASHPDVYSAPVFGPCIQFNGQLLQWSGDSFSNKGKVATDARITFEASTGFRVTSILEIENLGTTAIYYNWKV